MYELTDGVIGDFLCALYLDSEVAISMLSSWNDGAAKQAIETFVERVTTPGSPDFVEKPERIAAFDNSKPSKV